MFLSNCKCSSLGGECLKLWSPVKVGCQYASKTHHKTCISYYGLFLQGAPHPAQIIPMVTRAWVLGIVQGSEGRKQGRGMLVHMKEYSICLRKGASLVGLKYPAQRRTYRFATQVQKAVTL